MARKCFIGFDYDYAAGIPSINVLFADVRTSLPAGVSLVAKSSDTTFYSPGDNGAATTFVAGRNTGSSAFGHGAYTTANFEGSGSLASGTVAVTRSSIGSPQEVWVSMDVRLLAPSGNLDDPANLMRSEARYQIFKWGDLSLRFRRIYGYQASPLKFSWQFEAFNGVTSLGTISLVDYNASQWAYVRIRARLDSGTNGRFDITIDGVSLNTSGINTVATTALVDATHLYFSGGFIGQRTSGSIYIGAVDNILIDDAAFPSGRPAGVRAQLTGDGTLTNWAPSGAASITAALSGPGTARGTGTGATALVNLGGISTTGWESNLLGWQIVASGLSNLDPLLIRKLRTGIDLSGTPYNGSQIDTLTPPMTPSSITTGYNMDTVFYKGGGADFTLSDITNCKARLEVVA